MSTKLLPVSVSSNTIKVEFNISKAMELETVSCFPFTLQNMTFGLGLYPNGTEKSEKDRCAIYLYAHNIESIGPNDDRTLSVAIYAKGKFSEKYSFDEHPLTEWTRKDYGFHNFFKTPLKDEQKTIVAEITIKLPHYDTQNIEFVLRSQQLDSFYEMCKKHGDILLIARDAKAEEGEKDEDEKNETRIAGTDGNTAKEDEKTEMKLCAIDEKDVLKKGVRVSSAFLMSASGVFKKMLTSKMKESADKTVIIPGVSTKTIDDLIYYITTGILRQSVSVMELLELSHCYELYALNYACLDRLTMTLEGSNLSATIGAFETYTFKDAVTDRIYKKFIRRFIKNKEEILKDVKDKSTIPYSFLMWSDCVQN